MKISKKSFSLIETMVGIAVFGMMSLVITSMIISAERSGDNQIKNVTVLNEANWALELFSNELRHADPGSISVDWSGKGISFDMDTDGDNNPDTSIRYERQWVWGTGYTNIFVRSQQWWWGWWWWGWRERDLMHLCVDNPGGADIFSRNGGLVTITLTVRPRPDQAAGKNNRELTLKTRVRTRN